MDRAATALADRLGEIELAFRQFGIAGQALTQGIEAGGLGLQFGKARGHRVQFTLRGVLAQGGLPGIGSGIAGHQLHRAGATGQAQHHQAGRGQPGLAADEPAGSQRGAARMLGEGLAFGLWHVGFQIFVFRLPRRARRP